MGIWHAVQTSSSASSHFTRAHFFKITRVYLYRAAVCPTTSRHFCRSGALILRPGRNHLGRCRLAYIPRWAGPWSGRLRYWGSPAVCMNALRERKGQISILTKIRLRYWHLNDSTARKGQKISVQGETRRSRATPHLCTPAGFRSRLGFLGTFSWWNRGCGNSCGT